ncbi:MAG: thiamine diphosphokinase [Oscillospiraceae bacterium]|nr:thiamine diphosphokinase [Oscillospiraceae bacterium]
MGTCIIFCAGDFTALVEPIRDGDFIIAADGGLLHLNRLGVQPDAIIGDFDSLGHVPEGALVHPVEKDDTDSMLAVRLGLEKGFRRFVLYGAMGGSRLDHTIANLQTLQFLANHGAVAHLAGADVIATVIRNGSACFPAAPEGIVSVFCMGADAQGVDIQGLCYELKNGRLTAGYPLGVSNHFIGKNATISVNNGSLLIIAPVEVGFSEVEQC